MCCVTYISDNFIYLVFKLGRISGAELFAARGADLAVYLHFSVLDNELRVSAGHNCVAELQKSVETDKIRVYLFSTTGFSFILTLSFLTIFILLIQSLF